MFRWISFDNHVHPNVEHEPHPRELPTPQTFPVLSPPFQRQPLFCFLFTWMSFTSSWTSYKWIRLIFISIFFCATSCFLSFISVTWICSLSLLLLSRFPCMHIPPVAYPLSHWLFHVLLSWISTVNIPRQVCMWTYKFSFHPVDSWKENCYVMG